MPRTRKSDSLVLDTCSIIHDPKITAAFKNSTIIIPITVLEELDSVKSKSSAAGKNARVAIKKIYEYCLGGDVKKGIKIENGNTLVIDSNVQKNEIFNCGNKDDIILNKKCH